MSKSGTEIARRFPATQGYRDRHDIPTYTDMTSHALAMFSQGRLLPAELRQVCGTLALSWPARFNELPRGHARAQQMANEYAACSLLTVAEWHARKLTERAA